MQLNLCEHTCHLSVWLKSITTQNEVDSSLKIMKTDEKCPWSNALRIEAQQPRQPNSLKAETSVMLFLKHLHAFLSRTKCVLFEQ